MTMLFHSPSVLIAMVIIYTLLFLLGLLGIVLFHPEMSGGIAKTFQISAPFKVITWGGGCATGVILLSLIGSKMFRFIRVLEEEFRNILGELQFLGIVIIALVSGIAEETFFRGALQPLLGLTLTSFIFGLLHFPANQKYLPWTFFAIGMGFLLGLLYIKTNTVITPIIAHTLVNLVNLFRIYARK